MQLKKTLAGHDADVQFALLEPLDPVQRHGGGENTAHVHEAAAAGIASGGGALPHADKVQKSFGGHDVSGIQAHTGSTATKASQQMGASAYATGNHVAFAGTPDLHTVAHEAAHVVQQQAGVSLAGGVGKAGDAYENHADKVADKVVKGESAEGLLSQMTGGGPKGGVQQQSVQRRAIQRETSGASPVQQTTNPTHPAQVDIDADRARLAPVSTFEQYRDVIGTLRVAAKPASKSSVALRIGKLLTAIPATRIALDRYYGAQGPAKQKEYIDDRKALIEANLATWVTGARAALDKIQAAPAVDVADQWDATGPMKHFPAIQPEEITTAAVLDTVTQGVIKVFDAFSVWDGMDPAFQAGWDTHGGGKAGWMQACKAAGALVFAPAGKENLPPFIGKSIPDAFKGTVRGFVGMGTDAPVPTSFAHAIQHFALNAGWYPSGVMFLGHCTKDYLKSLMGSMPIGKPSIFYLLVFDENTYEPNDRTFGHLADPNDPTKPGPARELQTSGLPQAEFLGSGRVLS